MEVKEHGKLPAAKQSNLGFYTPIMNYHYILPTQECAFAFSCYKLQVHACSNNDVSTQNNILLTMHSSHTMRDH